MHFLFLLVSIISFSGLMGKNEETYVYDIATKLSRKHIKECLHATENPEWCDHDPEKVSCYYELQEEGFLDRNLGYITTHLAQAIVHGTLSQDQLAEHLETFDIYALLKNGPTTSLVLSLEAQALIIKSYKGLNHVIDIHLHNMGYDEGSYINPHISSFKEASFTDYLQFMALRYASGMTSVIGSSHDARRRLHLYSAHFPRFLGTILPIHPAYLENGTVSWAATGTYLSELTAYISSLSFRNPNNTSKLLAAVSVHPFDPKWKRKLLLAHARGIRIIKWMPPQSIDPSSYLLDPYYKLLRELNMTILAHGGPEHMIPTNEQNEKWQDYGNPLRFRKPLQMGVNVIVAHCGHKELIPDLDTADDEQKGYELYFRLAREAHANNWPGKVYGDLAAVTTHYGPDFIKELLLMSHEPGIRLLYGSDFPFTNLVQPGNDGYNLCAEAGLLDKKAVAPLKEIRAWNPLLANFIFTRALELDGIAFEDATFTGQFDNAPLF